MLAKQQTSLPMFKTDLRIFAIWIYSFFLQIKMNASVLLGKSVAGTTAMHRLRSTVWPFDYYYSVGCFKPDLCMHNALDACSIDLLSCARTTNELTFIRTMTQSSRPSGRLSELLSSDRVHVWSYWCLNYDAWIGYVHKRLAKIISEILYVCQCWTVIEVL
jgi:hypothetical protein